MMFLKVSKSGEVRSGIECGLNIHNFNDIKVGDIIESYKETEVKRNLT
jgi:translation initiation factor IF-2